MVPTGEAGKGGQGDLAMMDIGLVESDLVDLSSDDGTPPQEPFWMLPSTRANYTCIEVQAGSGPDLDVKETAAAVQKQMLKFGGRLAKQTQKVSSGLMQQAR